MSPTLSNRHLTTVMILNWLLSGSVYSLNVINLLTGLINEKLAPPSPPFLSVGCIWQRDLIDLSTCFLSLRKITDMIRLPLPFLIHTERGEKRSWFLENDYRCLQMCLLVTWPLTFFFFLFFGVWGGKKISIEYSKSNRSDNVTLRCLTASWNYGLIFISSILLCPLFSSLMI